VVLTIAKGRALDKESKAYAALFISEVATNWDEQALTSRASAEFTAVTSPTQIDQFFGQARELGRLIGCKELRG